MLHAQTIHQTHPVAGGYDRTAIYDLLKLAFVTNDHLLILDWIYSHLSWSDVTIRKWYENRLW